MAINNFHKIIIALLFILPLAAQAQFSGNISLRITPEFPGSFTTVRVTLDGLGVDLDRAKISWFLNEQISQTGIGEKNFRFKTGALGETNRLIVSVETLSGEKINTAALIIPAEANLVWEPVAYAPPFYKGKRLYTYESPIRVTAIPEIIENGRRLASDELVFKWKENYKLIQSASGGGKDTITVRSSVPLKPTVVSVEISTLDNAITAVGSITAEPGQPQILFYENNPLYGILWNRALTSPFALAQKEISVLASPYFFGVQNATDAKLKYDWTLNGGPVTSAGAKNILALRQESEQTGTALLSLRVSNTSGLFQFGDGSVSIELGKKSNDPNFFGF
ncbi:MAG: Uncharacterized protein CEO19_455 [Parcubacteria group bacterium Gr01-1014_73]|nr:MAG: Uncharacterized protein CEO19_455 [Parcubacteria group bacterium Gr01-1014_73]